ncbi:hypothetical protein D4R78_01355 [bacterium]|nr:MAG: hypothetical protein D4R78_01355 [bacterium]
MVYHLPQFTYRWKIILLGFSFWLSVSLAGCVTLKEAAKGVLGVSTKALEDNRKDAIKKTFNYDYNTCYSRAKEILKENKAYIYCEDPRRNLLAIYVSEKDTTAVGLFFKAIDQAHTQIEVSSGSTYAKELISDKLFKALGPE